MSGSADHSLDVLISREEIARRVGELAGGLNARYRNREITLVGVMSGCVVFLADLIRQLTMPLRIEFLTASSYRGSATSPGELQLAAGELPQLTGRDVVVLDDIFDTGRTLQAVRRLIRAEQPQSLRSIVLLWKTARNETGETPDEHGFEIPDRFVVGYGLDFDGLYRNLPEICALS
jgi:hypoxanthine phosphoribosyltransferase